MAILTKLSMNIVTGTAFIITGSLGLSLSATAKSLAPSISPSFSISASALNASDNLVTNGGFETGDFTGFTQSENLGSTSVETACGEFSPYSGGYCASLGPVGSLGILSQNLATVPGTTYSLTYFLASNGDTPNEFQTTVNGNQLFDQTDIPSQPYTQYSFDFTATSASTPLQFGFRNDPDYLALDNIAVSPVPEPSSEIGTFAFGTLGTM